ncbi:hypothetical protein SAMN05216561_11817 [Nocardioides psychrotolerans]|uniref:Uncharacterized protein n=1 Tax=Nocardioides psychrotolerans TaxID=1005945 RepID=A0A1I3NIX0_9ACTN|nr:hypothetical protein SAMN05216561_11817 [Nocardioides psychrotolerans]
MTTLNATNAAVDDSDSRVGEDLPPGRWPVAEDPALWHG